MRRIDPMLEWSYDPVSQHWSAKCSGLGFRIITPMRNGDSWEVQVGNACKFFGSLVGALAWAEGVAYGDGKD